MSGIGLLNLYREFLPVTENTPLITLGEGETPLIRSTQLSKLVECEDLFFKLEGSNPTGSFKDRGMVVAIAKAIEGNSARVICASTGNTSASAAAYGARFNLPVTVVVPARGVASSKLAQVRAHKAQIISIQGNFDNALSLVLKIAKTRSITMVNSTNPYRLQGQKTGAFEIIDQLGYSPDYLAIPVGNGGNISAYWLGFLEYMDRGLSKSLPRMLGFQAAGASPLVQNSPIEDPVTIASAIRIGNPVNWERALSVLKESKGVIEAVTDEEIVDACSKMASLEGIFCELASAASVAGILKLSKAGWNFHGKRVVCIITGSGLKQPDMTDHMPLSNIIEVPSTLDALEAAIFGSD
jgi:threonine synthase